MKLGLVVVKLYRSLIYSLQGLFYILKTELSFQLEVIYFVFSVILVFFLAIPVLEAVILLTTVVLILVAETFNTIVEMIIDKLSLERSDFAKHVKDLGSGAVFMLLLVSAGQWVAFLWPYFTEVIEKK